MEPMDIDHDQNVDLFEEIERNLFGENYAQSRNPFAMEPMDTNDIQDVKFANESDQNVFGASHSQNKNPSVMEPMDVESVQAIETFKGFGQNEFVNDQNTQPSSSGLFKLKGIENIRDIIYNDKNLYELYNKICIYIDDDTYARARIWSIHRKRKHFPCSKRHCMRHTYVPYRRN